MSRLALCGVFLCASASGGAPMAWAGAGKATSGVSARDMALARDYVLAACVMTRYKGTQLAAEADAWAGGLVEHGSLDADAYPALAELAGKAPAPGVTQSGLEMRLQSCVDFVHAKGFQARLKEALRR